jgi:hypothetical protein
VKSRSVCVGVTIWLALCVSAFANAVDHLNQAQHLLENGQHQSAYELLKSVENEAIGEVIYDRMLAEAAAGVGENSEATMILERLLHMNPMAIESARPSDQKHDEQWFAATGACRTEPHRRAIG